MFRKTVSLVTAVKMTENGGKLLTSFIRTRLQIVFDYFALSIFFSFCFNLLFGIHYLYSGAVFPTFHN